MARWDKPTSGSIPDWFWASVETKAEPSTVEVEDCDVAYQTWGSPGDRTRRLADPRDERT